MRGDSWEVSCLLGRLVDNFVSRDVGVARYPDERNSFSGGGDEVESKVDSLDDGVSCGAVRDRIEG